MEVILTEVDCNLSRVYLASLVPRRKDMFGSQSHYGFGQVEYGEILKIYPTEVPLKPCGYCEKHELLVYYCYAIKNENTHFRWLHINSSKVSR